MVVVRRIWVGKVERNVRHGHPIDEVRGGEDFLTQADRRWDLHHRSTRPGGAIDDREADDPTAGLAWG